jgi:Flp pilus assembly protein TadG
VTLHTAKRLGRLVLPSHRSFGLIECREHPNLTNRAVSVVSSPSRRLPAPPSSHHSRGQSLVEFSLVLPILLLLLVGITDFGRVFNAGIVEEAAARDAAEIGAQQVLADPPASGTYAGLHQAAARVVCAEMRLLAGSTYQSATGDCPGQPYVLVCVHDNADDACATEPFGAAIPAACDQLTSPPTHTRKVENASPLRQSTYVEVRVCFRFSTLVRLPLLPLGDFWLQRSRSFTVADYEASPSP